MARLEQIEDWVAPLLARLTAAERRKLARRIGIELRRSQARRIAAQQNPDGSPYAPRNREARGGIRRRAAMFHRLRTARFLKVKAQPAGVALEFANRVERMARIHQEGGMDAPARGQRRVRYARRELLGFTTDDNALVKRLLLDHLTGM